MNRASLAAAALLAAAVSAAGTFAADIAVTTFADIGPGSLREVVGNAPPGSVITFALPTDADGYDAATGKWTLTLGIGHIKFRKPLTFQGGGKVILDGRGRSRLLSSEGPDTLTLLGLTFKNGKAAVGNDYGNGDHGAGGAVSASGTVIATGCAFIGNTAEKSGGAVFAAQACTAENCAFTGNSADLFGGAVYTDKNAITATGCSFDGNTGDNGSALSACGSAAITNCTFTSNAQKYSGPVGGAVGGPVSGPVSGLGGGPVGGLVRIISIPRGAVRPDNIISGAVCADTVTAADCMFSNNTAHAGAAVSAITLTATDCTFAKNSADVSGGAVSVSGPFTAKACTFTGNTAARSGGAVNAGDKSVVNARDCVFTGNAARDAGGAISAEHSAVATGCTFADNEAGRGGAMAVIYATARRSTFTGNLTLSDGGAMYAASTAIITGSTFTRNTAVRNGGAVFTLGTITTANSSFARNNTGHEFSGTIDATSTAYLYHITVADNTGAGVYVRDAQGQPKLYAYNGVIIGNSAEVQAGFGFLNKISPFPAREITGSSLIEGITPGVVRAAIFGDGADGIITPLVGGPADKKADALTADGITVPGGIKVADMITVLQKDVTGSSRPASGKVCYGAKE